MLRSVLAGEPLAYALASHSLPLRSKWSESASATCNFLPAYQMLTQQQLQDQVLKFSRAHATRGQQSTPLVPTASGGLGINTSDRGSSEADEREDQEKKQGDSPGVKAGTSAVKRHGRERTDGHPQKQGESSYEELQILERKARSRSSEVSTTGTSSEKATATELIFRLERQGDGWAEEILPRFSVVKRPLATSKPPPQGDRPPSWEEGSPEQLLRDRCDVPEDEIDDLLTTATAWRVTPAGRPLIDRRRRRRVARNVEAVADYLERLGVPPGRAGVGKVLRQLPQLMLCKPSSADRWDRRATELAAYAFHTGSCNVSEDDKECFELAAWVKRQRVLWQQGNLMEDRMKLLSTLGFEAGVETAITEEWEYRFDQLVEWLLLLGVNKTSRTAEGLWLGLDWGQRGGLQGRECCLWAQLQRELRRRNLLPAEAVKRLDNLKFQWELQGENPQEVRWVRQLGRLAFEIERSRKLSDVVHNSAAYRERQRQAHARDKQPDLPPKSDASILLGQEEDSRAAENVWMQQRQSYGRTLLESWRLHEEQDRGLARLQSICEESKSQGGAPQGGVPRPLKLPVLVQEVFARRRALQAAQLGPGLSYWLAKQQWRWRRGRLPQEQTLLLRLLGVDFDLYTLEQWRKEAHTAAAFLLDSHLSVDLPRPRKNQRRSSHGHSDGLMQSARGARGLKSKGVRGARLRVERWVLTQQALYSERRLSMPQIRYLALLELSWLLNRQCLRHEYLLWGQGLPRHISESRHEDPVEAELRAQQLRALRTLGWLGVEQEAEMRTAGVDPAPRRSREDRKWDERLTELLAYRREFGDCCVPASGWDTAPELRPWLVEQQKRWRQEQLPAKRSTQLAALGVERQPN